ncbi:HAMP domain-containing sensor histidine kinase [Bernardetia sp. Wsw4-3y2]|uniref:sensor histidine kinase n=1 Tax=Bernardetia sp. Wsw4-3y2 TaxID=3127471 RepID=UPI0030CD66A6
MKKLLNKTLLSFTIYSLVVLLASVPTYFYFIDAIWISELDENNELIAEKIEHELQKLEFNQTELNQSIILLNKIQPNTNLEKTNSENIIIDSTYTIFRKNPYLNYEDINRFRGLSKTIKLNEKNYILTVESNLEESSETVVAIAQITFVFLIVLLVGFLVLNRVLSVRLWKPFRSTLSKLKNFNLTNNSEIEFKKTTTFEFEELNIALSRLIKQNIQVYQTQKEFTENASHELQTPLAILKGKLSLLLQEKELTTNQYQIIEEMNTTLTRISRINKNLLLLAKIENNQFQETTTIEISKLMSYSLEILEEHFEHKNLTIQTHIEPNLSKDGNPTLVEILINNLLLNAIRHSNQHEKVSVILTKEKLKICNSGNATLEEKDLFNRFVKVSNSSLGSGLGLNIIKQICNSHKWKVLYQFENNFHVFVVEFS